MADTPVRKRTRADRFHEMARGEPSPYSQPMSGKTPQPDMLVSNALSHSSSITDEVSFLRLPEVKAITGLSKSSLYGLIRDKNFPPPVHLGPRAVAWVRSEVRQWAAQRVHASRSAA